MKLHPGSLINRPIRFSIGIEIVVCPVQNHLLTEHVRCAVPIALTLRQGLLEIANARTAQAGRQSKAEQVYNYLTGSRFKQRIEAVVNRFKDMREDIDEERKFMTKAWAKREAKVTAMIDSTVGMVGDLHGIVGQAMPEIPAIDDPPLLEGKPSASDG